ncbi:MAG: alpha/beta hydrolase [Pseudomonadota bacterium]|jgi:acetyl esterase/lipase|nr:alpha/beta hydrolase [Pseudomonadota bacterium]
MAGDRGQTLSLRGRVLNAALTHVEKPALARIASVEEARQSFRRKARLFFRSPRGATYTPVNIVRDLPGLRITGPETGAAHLLYFHGGGYIMGGLDTHKTLVAQMAIRCGACAWMTSYRLAPEHPFPAAFDDGLAAYRGLLDRGIAPDQIAIGGDSAGGGLALAVVAAAAAENLPLPRACFAFSPWTDLTFSGASVLANAKTEVMLPIARRFEISDYYLQGQSAVDPNASPLFGGCPVDVPTFLTASATEALLDDTRRMADKLRQIGAPVHEVIEPNLPHAWPIFGRILPEAIGTIDALARWLVDQGWDGKR